MNQVNKPPRTVERLDVECEEDRLHRFRYSLEKLNRGSTSGNTVTPSFDFEYRNPALRPINPPTELLSRVQAFLPALEASNAILAQRAHADPKSVDIEHIDEGMEQYIEMDLGLGVFEDRTHASKSHSSTSDSDSVMSKSSTSASEETDTDSDTDSTSSDEIITAFKPIRPIKPLPRRSLAKRANIVVLGEHP